MFQTVIMSLNEGFFKSLEIFLLTLLGAIPLGLIISFGSMSSFKPLKGVVKTLVWIIRGSPLMLQLLLVYYGPGMLGYNIWGTGSSGRFAAAMAAFILNYACYFSEIFRGGIESIPKGQKEAGQVLGMTGSGFIDPDGNGNGGQLAGYAMCDGVAYGSGHMGWGNKRLELHEDNLFYIKDVSAPVGEGTTDAVEFQPALIIDGNIVVDANCGWTGLQPRACIGQSDRYEFLMLVIEGRMPLRSTGTHVIECAEILQRHGCMQAMNLDGGTSAILWYDGEYIIRCSNQALPAGRTLPNACVYEKLAK